MRFSTGRCCCGGTEPCGPCTDTSIVYTIEFTGVGSGVGSCTNCNDFNNAFEYPMGVDRCYEQNNSLWSCSPYDYPFLFFGVRLEFLTDFGSVSHIQIAVYELNESGLPLGTLAVFYKTYEVETFDCSSLDAVSVPRTIGNTGNTCDFSSATCTITSGTI